MTIGSILLSISLLIIVLGFLARPFFLPKWLPTSGSKRLILLAQKNQLLLEIQRLDMDYGSGILSEADYQLERTKKVQQAAQLLRQLYASLPKHGKADSLDATIEAAIAQFRDLELAAKNAVCPACGTAIKASDRFCAHCGQPLESSINKAVDL